MTDSLDRSSCNDSEDAGRQHYRPEDLLMRRRVLLADDHTLLLEAFEKLLEPDYAVVGAVS